eukprot:TRINITY_DN1826_c0_g1_i3.p1 TRINITY_DN1826_c0_g1~~TRINITY_DN1826_c0_g1_i3.p1  ORF type:complete len:356 (-),score=60.36 TRINITY_DN1826_c0_g1_i3:190-1257(-)
MEDLPLLPSGRPVILPNEVEVFVCEEVDLIHNNESVPGLIFRLTTHRILLQKKDYSKQLQLQLVQKLAIEPHGWFTNSNVIYVMVGNNDRHQFSFNKSDRDSLHEQFLKSWKELDEQQKKQKSNLAFTPTGAGISGIIRKKEEKHEKTTQILDQAFSDLNVLIGNARDMVMLAQRLKANHPNNEEKEVNDLILQMGMESPVSKCMMGQLFHSELARQLSDFLRIPLQQNNGIMSLIDVYCLYNRARGTDLISPEDLFRSCLLFEELRLPLFLRKFESGLLCIQCSLYNDKVVLDSILNLVKCNFFPLTVAQFASKQNTTLGLASFYLLKAEEQEILCRDESFEGLIFYQNIFIST